MDIPVGDWWPKLTLELQRPRPQAPEPQALGDWFDTYRGEWFDADHCDIIVNTVGARCRLQSTAPVFQGAHMSVHQPGLNPHRYEQRLLCLGTLSMKWHGQHVGLAVIERPGELETIEGMSRMSRKAIIVFQTFPAKIFGSEPTSTGASSQGIMNLLCDMGAAIISNPAFAVSE